MNVNIFIISLLQDINIVRPLIYLSDYFVDRRILLLVSHTFKARDTSGVWQTELHEIAKDTKVEIFYISSSEDVLNLLNENSGIIISASESDLPNHRFSHDIFKLAPSSFLKITLQHGFECVGFMQSKDQDRAHGTAVSFAADIICGWSNSEKLYSIVDSQKHKLIATGSTSLINFYPKINISDTKNNGMGLICENMHSSRLNTSGDFKSEFLSIFDAFCSALARDKQKISLRPHPGGQYVIRNNVSLLDNVIIENDPIYKVNLSRFAYGISAPSSIIIDMVLADIPTAVWKDKDDIMDTSNYDGLTHISGVDDWISFKDDAINRPSYYIDKQKEFLIQSQIKTNVLDGFRVFLDLLNRVK